MRTVVGNQLTSLKHDGKRHYENITVTCLQGQIAGIVGSDPASVSHLISTLGGHLNPESGRVLYDGSELGQKGGEVNMPLEVLSKDIVFPSVNFFERFFSGERYTLSRADLIIKFFPNLTHSEIKKGAKLNGSSKLPVKLCNYMSLAHKAFFLDQPFVGFSDEQITTSLNMLRELADRFKDIIWVSGLPLEKLQTVCDVVYSTDTNNEVFEKQKPPTEEPQAVPTSN